MKVLVLGSGAREHALAWKLSHSSRVSAVFAGPGNAGTSEAATNLPEVDPLKFDTVAAAVRKSRADCVFIGPETPLAAGVADFLAGQGMLAIGPGKTAAQLESSKAFSKAFLVRNGIPTAAASEFSDPVALEAFLSARPGQRLVVKKSGLAAGKGVLESDRTEDLASFGRAALAEDRVLVEEYLQGWELSVFGISDGESHAVLPACTDFKKAGEGDTGPNTGGMGSICPVPPADGALMQRIEREIVAPTYAAMKQESLSYIGVLYFGLMITPTGPRVLEYNVRFGDPETQVLLPVLSFDLGGMVEALVEKKLGVFSAGIDMASNAGAALGVVVAAHGYPESTGSQARVQALCGGEPGSSHVFHASTFRDDDGALRVRGGRCFTVVGIGPDLRTAAERAYTAVQKIRFDGGWYRRDIGRRFLGVAP